MSVVKLRESAGFQSTPFGYFELGVAPPTQAPEAMAGGVSQSAIAAEPAVHERPKPLDVRPRVAPTSQAIAVLAVDSPRAAQKAIRARIKEIKAALRHMKALQKELADYERMLSAAREKPKSTVRALRSA